MRLSDKHLKTLVLLDIQRGLQSREKELCHVMLPEPTVEDIEGVEVVIGNKLALMREEIEFNVEELVAVRKQNFTEEQRKVFDRIVGAAEINEPL